MRNRLAPNWTRVTTVVLMMLLSAAISTSAVYAEKLQSRAQNSFTATAVLVNDPEGESKWSAPPPVVPNFILARRVAKDEPATLLVFFSNSSREQENIQVSCDMEIRDSRRQVVARLDPSFCLAVAPSSKEADVYLFPEMKLTEDHGTASGPLTLTIGVTDEVCQERIDLVLDIEVEEGRR